MSQVPGRFEQCLDFVAAQDHGELVLVPWHGDAANLDLLVERVRVEEPEGADGLDVGGRAGVLDVEEMQLPVADFVGAEAVGRPVEVVGELGDTPDVGGYGGRGVVADAEILQHPLAEGCHG